MSSNFLEYFQLVRSKPAFRRVFYADALSQIGQNMLVVAFPTLILEVTGDVTLTGLAFSGEIIAYGLLSPYAGLLADRIEQKHMMLFANFARSLLLALLLASLAQGYPPAFYLALSVLLGAAGALFGPARAAFLRRLLHGEELVQAAALEGTVMFLLRLFSPALMGILLVLGDVRLGVAIDALLYVVSSTLILPGWVTGPRVAQADEREDRGVREGWLFLSASSTLKPLLALDGIICLVGMATWSTAVAFLEEVLHVRAANNGWLQASAGVAGALGTVLAGKVPRGPYTNAWMLSALSVSYLCMGQCTSLSQLVAVWFMRGLVFGVLTVFIAQQLAREVPSHLMGRVQAAWEQLALVGCFLGSASSPWLLRNVGALGAFRLFGLVMLGFTCVWWLKALSSWPRPGSRPSPSVAPRA